VENILLSLASERSINVQRCPQNTRTYAAIDALPLELVNLRTAESWRSIALRNCCGVSE